MTDLIHNMDQKYYYDKVILYMSLWEHIVVYKQKNNDKYLNLFVEIHFKNIQNNLHERFTD